MTFTDLYAEIAKFVEAGDEAGARAFIVEHIQEFPEEAREAIVFEFFKEALGTQTDAVATVQNFKSEGKKIWEVLNEADAELENQAKIIELKEQLQK
ncbi:MAG: hypothetical protein RIQ56_414 [Candidatus Parcubacteria bacterium]|jgi:hypothetical protein